MNNAQRNALSLCIAAAASMLAASASAAPITYGVDQVIAIGSVTGSITTDGATGTLSQADITDWDLLLSDGTDTYTLTTGSAVFLQGSDVTADASHIYFNYSGSDSGVLAFQQNLFSGAHYYCNATAAASFYCKPGESVVPTDVYSDPGFPYITPTGVQVIASVAAVPEPETFALMALGLAGLAFGTRLRKTRRA